MGERRFIARLAPWLVLALVLRLVYSLLIVKDQPLLGDGLEFHLLANLLADGKGYVEAMPFHSGPPLPTADKPPLFPLVLALFTKIGGHGYEAHHVATALMGTGTVAAAGYLGRRAAGDRVGLTAAAIAAVYPLLIAADGSMRSESLYALLIALTLISAYRLLDRPGVRRAAECGVLIGLATLTRSEAIVLVVLLVLPVGLLAATRAEALKLSAVSGLVALVVLAPWLVRCWAEFDRPVFVSTNSGGLLAGANCDKTYHGEFLGQWVFDCLDRPEGDTEVEVSANLASRGIDYATDHSGRLAVVVPVRVLRSWELYRPRQQWHIERFFEGRDLQLQKAGILMYYMLAGLAIAGAIGLRRRGQPLRILVAPFVLVTLVSIGAYGFTRFRVAAEVPIVVLASLVIAPRLERLRRGRSELRQAQAQAG